MNENLYEDQFILHQAVLKLKALLDRCGKALCTKQLDKFGLMVKTEHDFYDPNATSYSCVLSSDGQSGIVPVWFVVYRYNQLSGEIKSLAKSTLSGPKALQSLKTKETAELAKQLSGFEKLHKNKRFVDINDKRSERFFECLSLIKQTLIQIHPLVCGEFHQKNPENDQPDDRIAYFDLYLKDPQDVDKDGIYQTKIRLLVASPDFIKDSLLQS